MDGKVVGNCPKILGPNLDLTLEQLIYKTVSLIVLVTAQRVQSLHLPNMTETKKTDSCFFFFRLGQIKQRRPRNTGFEVGVPKWPENPYICPHETSAKQRHNSLGWGAAAKYLSASSSHTGQCRKSQKHGGSKPCLKIQVLIWETSQPKVQELRLSRHPGPVGWGRHRGSPQGSRLGNYGHPC